MTSSRRGSRIIPCAVKKVLDLDRLPLTERPAAFSFVLWSVIAAGLGVLVHAGWTLIRQPIGLEWLLLAALTVLSGSAALRVPAGNMSFSVADTFAFTAMLLFGPAAATVTVALDALAISLRLERKSVPRVLFNVTATSLAMWIAAVTFLALAEGSLTPARPVRLVQLLPALALATAIYFLVNTGLVAIVVGLQANRRPWTVWRASYLRLWLGYAGGAYVAALLVVYARELDPRFLMALVPIPIVLYYTFKTSLGRVDDELRHLNEMNLSYQRMMETLAHTIDAKDQVTHDHIRRVQESCVRLARVLGVTDESELRAIRAGALLHDIGKLAVPEHILNKPGQLTEAEFAEIKKHASVGADILANAAFPYPVVPIVRHHHEAWDGSGYPDGISGDAIPLGARILSVVDCFDALVSDFFRAEAGFFIAPEFWGTGIFADAGRLIVDFAFGIVGIHRIEARVVADNTRSTAALQKLGAVREGTLHDAFVRDGHYVDQVMWSLLRRHWLQTR